VSEGGDTAKGEGKLAEVFIFRSRSDLEFPPPKKSAKTGSRRRRQDRRPAVKRRVPRPGFHGRFQRFEIIEDFDPGRPCMSVYPPPPGRDNHPRMCALSLCQPGNRDPHTGPGAPAAAEEGGSAPASGGSGKLSRLRCVHPRRRTSASYARAASSFVANYPTT